MTVKKKLLMRFACAGLLVATMSVSAIAQPQSQPSGTPANNKGFVPDPNFPVQAGQKRVGGVTFSWAARAADEPPVEMTVISTDPSILSGSGGYLGMDKTGASYVSVHGDIYRVRGEEKVVIVPADKAPNIATLINSRHRGNQTEVTNNSPAPKNSETKGAATTNSGSNTRNVSSSTGEFTGAKEVSILPKSGGVFVLTYEDPGTSSPIAVSVKRVYTKDVEAVLSKGMGATPAGRKIMLEALSDPRAIAGDFVKVGSDGSIPATFEVFTVLSGQISKSAPIDKPKDNWAQDWKNFPTDTPANK